MSNKYIGHTISPFIAADKFLRTASMTVEVSLLMPVILAAIFAVLYLTAHLHGRTCLFAEAAEQAVSGHEQEDPSLFAVAEIAVTRSDEKDRREISYSAGTFHFSGENLWTIKEKATYKKYHPVKLIRRKNAAKDVLDS
ncbi:MAG: hypothetical protein IJJ52_05780 [Lachnospiraceae bacterium]|nr:hypothetical protein [Lachnospiraceae bacterium]